jgi:hypothetical protein
MALSRELCEFVDNDCSCWHVDTESQSFSREDNSHQSFDETLLNGFFEWRNEPSVMAGYTSFE